LRGATRDRCPAPLLIAIGVGLCTHASEARGSALLKSGFEMPKL